MTATRRILSPEHGLCSSVHRIQSLQQRQLVPSHHRVNGHYQPLVGWRFQFDQLTVKHLDQLHRQHNDQHLPRRLGDDSLELRFEIVLF
jgi:hypothetical protein